MPAKLSDAEKLARNAEYINDPDVRAGLFKQFMPTFFYHKEEESFPLHPDDFVENIIRIKRDEYTNIQARQKRDLTPEETKELEIIEKYFWKNGDFNPNYKQHESKPDFQKMIDPSDGSNSKFLVFDEKKYGYKVGEKIDIVGVAPEGHPKHIEGKKSAPIAASIIPTKEGFFIQYESTYAFNNAIKGTRFLRDLLPSAMADKADNFGLHYGDCEGMGIYVTVDEKSGVASMKSMQTFAHGRDGAREVPVENCTFKDGRPAVFVGLGGHPSYADNFVGRNKLMDVVGDAYKITPQEFIDVSPDKIEVQSPDIPASLNTFPRFADSNPMVFSRSCHARNEKELEVQSKQWHRYKPSLILTKAWNKIKSFVQKLRGKEEENNTPPAPLEMKAIIESKKIAKDSPKVEQSKSVAQGQENEWTNRVGKKEDRASSISTGKEGRT